MLSRRSFIRRTAAATALLGFPSILRSASPNGMLQVAVVGCNGQGFDDLSALGSHPKVKFVGFCDIDTSRTDKANKKFPDVPNFQDYREMFAKLGDGFDAVQVSTPDHWHALIALDAMRKGKHVYCQKPLTHTVWEARQLRLGADKAKVITQMGNQIHSYSEYRTAVKWIRDGVIGKIKAVHSWVGNKGNGFTKLAERPQKPGATPPATLNWDMWLGAAPARDYQPGIYAPFNWRDWMDFGGGGLGDFGCHIMDTPFSALDLTSPLSVHADIEEPHPETWCKTSTVSYIFPGTAFTADKTIPVTWYDGGRRPEASLTEGKLPGGGTLYIGEGGTLIIPHVAPPKVYPAAKFADAKLEPVKGASHYHVWADAVLENKRTSDGFHYAGPLTETVQLGLVATRFPGKTLEWNAAEMKLPNVPEAEKYLTKQYREGYVATPV